MEKVQEVNTWLTIEKRVSQQMYAAIAKAAQMDNKPYTTCDVSLGIDENSFPRNEYKVIFTNFR